MTMMTMTATTKYDHPQLIYGHPAHGIGYLKSMRKEVI
jgi:hypothetical protein